MYFNVYTHLYVSLTIWHAGIYDHKIVCSPNKMKSDLSKICVWEEIWIGIMYFLAHWLWSSHSCIAEDSCLLACETVSLEWYFQSFEGHTLPTPSGWRCQSIRSRLLDPEDKGTVILHKNGILSKTQRHIPEVLNLHFSACLQSIGTPNKTTKATCTRETNQEWLNRFA